MAEYGVVMQSNCWYGFPQPKLEIGTQVVVRQGFPDEDSALAYAQKRASWRMTNELFVPSGLESDFQDGDIYLTRESPSTAGIKTIRCMRIGVRRLS
ncbi:MAG: hypothetical protein V1659_00860 [Candidatus Woesearchaeota archaeon]